MWKVECNVPAYLILSTKSQWPKNMMTYCCCQKNWRSIATTSSLINPCSKYSRPGCMVTKVTSQNCWLQDYVVHYQVPGLRHVVQETNCRTYHVCNQGTAPVLVLLVLHICMYGQTPSFLVQHYPHNVATRYSKYQVVDDVVKNFLTCDFESS